MSAARKREPKFSEVNFSGVMTTIQASKNGDFSNYQIVTAVIESGVVKSLHKSQPYAAFEAMAKLEIQTDRALNRLVNQYKDGLTLSLGSEDRTRIGKADPNFIADIEKLERHV